MTTGRDKTYYFVIGFLSIAFLAFFFFSGTDLTGYATSDSQVGNLSAGVQTYMACVWSTPTLNIDFGTALNPGTNDINGTDNYVMSPGTGYNVSVSGLSTASADITILGNDLIDGANVIGVGNITWQASAVSATDASLVPAGSNPITTSAIDIATGITPGSATYYRFWMDVPADSVAGNYIGNYTIECGEAA